MKNLKKFGIVLALLTIFTIAHASAESYGNTWWYHVAGGNSVARFESGVDTYSRSDRGHYILFGSLDTFKKAVSIIELYCGKADYHSFADYFEYIEDVNTILTRTASSYDAMKAYSADKYDYWYAIIWLPD